jgi:hypothetical protein
VKTPNTTTSVDTHRRADVGAELAAAVRNLAAWSTSACNVERARFSDLAARDGLQINFDLVVHTNTFDAHRRIAQGQQPGVRSQESGVESLLRTHYTDRLNIGDPDVLDMLAWDEDDHLRGRQAGRASRARSGASFWRHQRPAVPILR